MQESRTEAGKRRQETGRNIIINPKNHYFCKPTMSTMKNSLSSNNQPQTSSVIRAPLSVIRYQYDNHLGSACLEVATSCLRPPFSFSPSSFPQCSGTGMRYYVPWLCRFVSVDPLQFEYPHYTPYQYAGNKPVTYIDLDGAEELIPPLQNYSEPLSETNVSFSFTAFNSAGYSFENGSYVEYFNYTFAQMDASLQGENLYYSTEVGTGTVGYQFISPTNSWELVYLDSQYSSSEGMVNVSAEKTGSWWGILDWVQTGLDVLGLIPGAGEIFDLVNAGIYAIRGDYVSAGLSLAATIPIAGSLATGVKVANKVVKSADAAKVGFESFSAFKKSMGSAGPGQAWYHIVEQTPGNITKFGNQTIHNTSNLIKLPHGAGSIHTKVSGYYSSIQPFTNGVTVRKWLSTQSYQAQYDFGIQTLKKYNWKP